MKVIVAGSRTIHDLDVVKKAIEESGFQVDEIVSAMAPGVDRLGEEYAEDHQIPVQRFVPNTQRYKLGAWYKVNEAMAKYADALVAVHNGGRGTTHMINQMRAAGKPIHEVRVALETAG